eukprot:4830687-Amphidinium_carterae.1
MVGGGTEPTKNQAPLGVKPLVNLVSGISKLVTSTYESQNDLPFQLGCAKYLTPDITMTASPAQVGRVTERECFTCEQGEIQSGLIRSCEYTALGHNFLPSREPVKRVRLAGQAGDLHNEARL